MNNKIFFYIKIIIIFAGILIILNSTDVSAASTPKLVSTLQKAFESIEEWLIKLATPAAAVAVRNRIIYEKI